MPNWCVTNVEINNQDKNKIEDLVNVFDSAAKIVCISNRRKEFS